MNKEQLRQELTAVADTLADKARKPSEFPCANGEYKAIRYVIKNIDKLYS